MAHTPGPWKSDGDYIIAGGTVIGWTKLNENDDHILAVSAPDLLEALKALDGIERGMQGWHEDAKANVWARARAAIAKAEGRS